MNQMHRRRNTFKAPKSGPRRVGCPKFRAFFFPLSPPFRSSCVSLVVFSWNFGGVWSARTLKCARLGSGAVAWSPGGFGAKLLSKVQVSLSIILLARTMGQIAFPTRVSPFLLDKHSILHTNWDSSMELNNFTEMMIVRKCQSFPHRRRSVLKISTSFSTPLDKGLVDWKTGCPLSLNLLIINSATLSKSLWSFVVKRIPLCFWSRSEEWPMSGWESFFRSAALAFHSR